MSWNNFIFILVSLLYLNVLAAEAYAGDSRNWNPRDLSRTLQRQPPHPYSPPHHSLPRPLPKPLELSSNAATTEIPNIETKPTEVVSEYPHSRSVYPGTRSRFNFQRQPYKSPPAETAIPKVVSYPPVAIASMRDDDTSAAIPVSAELTEIAPAPAEVAPAPTVAVPEPVVPSDQAVVAPQPFNIAPEPVVIAPEPEPMYVQPPGTTLEEPISNEDIEAIRQPQVTEAPPAPTTYVTPAQPLRVAPTKPPSFGKNLFRPLLPTKPLVIPAPTKPPTYTNKPPLRPPVKLLVTPTRPPTYAKNDVLLRRDDLEPPQLMDYQCNQENAFYGIENECGAYVECQAYIARMNTCPEGLHFNTGAVWPEYPCANPLQAKCEKSYLIPSPPRPIVTADCPSENGIYAKSGDCSQYVVCEEGVGILMNCPPGLVFSSQTSTCDWAENVPSCTLEIFRGFTCPAPPLEEDGSVSDEIFKFRHGQSCKEYVACHHGHPRLLRCDAGLSFDEESKVCVDTDYVTNCKY